MSNAEYEASFGPIMHAFRNWRLVAQDDKTVVDVEKRTVVMQANSTADTDLGPYKNEYVLVVYMTDEEKPMIDRIEEWVDSAVSMDLIPKLRAYVTEKEGNKL